MMYILFDCFAKTTAGRMIIIFLWAWPALLAQGPPPDRPGTYIQAIHPSRFVCSDSGSPCSFYSTVNKWQKSRISLPWVLLLPYLRTLAAKQISAAKGPRYIPFYCIAVALYYSTLQICPAPINECLLSMTFLRRWVVVDHIPQPPSQAECLYTNLCTKEQHQQQQPNVINRNLNHAEHTITLACVDSGSDPQQKSKKRTQRMNANLNYPIRTPRGALLHTPRHSSPLYTPQSQGTAFNWYY